MRFLQHQNSHFIAPSVLLLVLQGCAPSIAADGSGDAILPVEQGRIVLKLGEHLPVPAKEVRDWVQRAATGITAFYGKYPVKQVVIEVSAADSGAVRDGVEFNGEHISIKLGKDTTSTDLANDWMITHEMFHLSQPSLDDDYSWMSEGMADYLEPVSRARVGQISAERFWKDLVEGLPQGLPQAGDQGLDHTHTWARTYWGGSLFWLLADVRVREQTHNAKSVRDAALAALNDGGDGSQDWTIDRLLAAYDRGTATKVFTTLHNEMGAKAVMTDLGALWKSLGVVYSKETGEVRFDDTAPLAAVRWGMTVK